MHQQQLAAPRLRTGSQELDKILRGGFERGLLTLIYGSSRVNQILLELAVITQLPPNHGGLNGCVIFIDAANSFNTFEIGCYARRHALAPAFVLNQIHVVRAFSHSMLLDAISTLLPAFLADFSAAEKSAQPEGPPPMSLLISGLGAPETTGRRLDKVEDTYLQALGTLKTVAMRYNLPVVATGKTSAHSDWRPAGGTPLEHAAQVQLLIREHPDRIEYTLLKHPSLAMLKAIQWQTKVYTDYTLEMFLD